MPAIRVVMPNGTTRSFREATSPGVIRQAKRDMLAEMKASGEYDGSVFESKVGKSVAPGSKCNCEKCNQVEVTQSAPAQQEGLSAWDKLNMVLPLTIPITADAQYLSSPSTHDYTLKREVCAVNDKSCTNANMDQAHQRNQYPFQGDSIATPGAKDTVVPFLKWLFGETPVGRLGDITVQEFKQGNNRGLTNQTLDGHIFHDGQVDRYPSVENGKIYMNTHGYGTHSNRPVGWFNQLVGPMLFRQMDTELVDDMNPHRRPAPREVRGLWD